MRNKQDFYFGQIVKFNLLRRNVEFCPNKGRGFRLLIATIMILFFSMFFTSCKKFVEVGGPKTSLSIKNVYNNNASAIGVLTSLYSNLSIRAINAPGELVSLSCIAGLSADELTLYPAANDGDLSAYYENKLTNLSSDYWKTTYKRIYVVNEALEALPLSTGLTPAVKKQLLGEARFMRAFYYFYLVNLYGDVPLVLTTDYSINALIAKSPKDQVYQQIISDLKEAQNLLSDQYLEADCITVYPRGAEERIRPTKWAAVALLARVYTYESEWANAEAEANLILANASQYSLVPLNQVFLKNNPEAIWQLQPISAGYNTADAYLFILPSTGPGPLNPVFLNDDLVNSFEPGDQRKSNWIGRVIANSTIYNFADKYKVTPSGAYNSPVSEYNTVMRLAEQVLIRAEARAHLNNLGGAIMDIDQIRGRAGLPLIAAVNPGINQLDLIAEVLRQRELEFFTEWGHRWLDLKRTGNIDAVMGIATPQKSNGGLWKSYQQLYPIPLDELNKNPNLTATPGY